MADIERLSETQIAWLITKINTLDTKYGIPQTDEQWKTFHDEVVAIHKNSRGNKAVEKGLLLYIDYVEYMSKVTPGGVKVKMSFEITKSN